MDKQFLERLGEHAGVPAAAVNYGCWLLERRDAIRAERYSAERLAEELGKVNVETVTNLRAVETSEHAGIDARTAAKLSEQETGRAARSAERRNLADVIDVTELRSTADTDQILELCADAQAFSPETGRAARAIALPVLRRLSAAVEQRRQLNSKPFLALCRLSAEQNSGAGGGTSRAEIEAAAAAEKRATTSALQQLADALGLGAEFKMNAVTSTVTAPAKVSSGGIVIGPYFEQSRRSRGGA